FYGEPVSTSPQNARGLLASACVARSVTAVAFVGPALVGAEPDRAGSKARAVVAAVSAVVVAAVVASLGRIARVARIHLHRCAIEAADIRRTLDALAGVGLRERGDERGRHDGRCFDHVSLLFRCGSWANYGAGASRFRDRSGYRFERPLPGASRRGPR